ncbi:MAG: ankyrin repeat domain-containing protein [Candidatus Binataceae bacterium]
MGLLKIVLCLAVAGCRTGPNLDVAGASDLESALFSAVARGDTKAVRELSARGADVNAFDPDSGRTPLALAAVYGHAEIARILIASGANLEAKSDVASCERTPLILAVRWATAFGGEARAAQVVRVLIAAGANVNAKDCTSATPLMFAALDGHTEIVRYLIANGADVNACDIYGENALLMAQRERHQGIVRELERAGAKPACRHRD